MTLDRKSLRKTLRSWDQSKALGESAFADLKMVEARRRASGYGDTQVGYGVALREVLQEAISTFRSGQSDPDPLQKSSRHYQILTGEYIRGRSAEFLASEMGIARNTYNHEKAAALDRLLSLLDEWEQDAHSQPIGEGGQRVVAVPFMVPPRPPHGLVGREDLLAKLDQLLADHGRLALSGLPGVGKSALAIELSHRRKSEYPDGVLWTSLGPCPDALVQFHLWEVAMGLHASEVSDLLDQNARAAQLHAMIGDRRMLLIVDDIWDEAEARAFEIGGEGCQYVFTSRSPKVCAALSGDQSIVVPELDETEGLLLLEQYVPAKKMKTDRRRELVNAVGGLPQALVIAGSALRAAAYADQPRRMAEFLERLAEPSERLYLERARSALDQQAGIPSDQPISVQAIIALSDEALPTAAQAALRNLSVMPPKPSTFGETAAEAIAGATVQELDELTDAGLLEPSGSERYTIHRTIADFGRTRSNYFAPVESMVSYFDRLVQQSAEEFNSIQPDLQNILTALRLANEHGLAGEYSAGVNALYSYLDANGLLDEAMSLLQAALESSPEVPDTLLNMGRVFLRRGAFEEARFYFGKASETDDPSIVSAAFLGRGACEFSSGNYEGAVEDYSRGLMLATEHGLREREAALLTNLGILAVSRGDSGEAESRFNDALRLARIEGDRALLGSILTNLGVIAAQNQQFDMASDRFEEAVEMARSDGNRRMMAYLHINMGALAHDRGDLDCAENEFRSALELARELGDRRRMSHALSSLTAIAIAQREYDDAERYAREGLQHARTAQISDSVVLLLINQAELRRELGEIAAERDLLLEAQSIAEEIEHDRYRQIISDRLDVNLESS